MPDDEMAPTRVISASRLKYDAEVKIFRGQHGGLEDVRTRLGLTRRKMAQLLLVDPSAWTRWCKDESKVPPHVYRALEWYLALSEKVATYPELANVFNARFKALSFTERDQTIDNQREIASLRAQIRDAETRQRRVAWCLVGAILALAATLAFVAIR